jgi:hypothetical protein
MGISSIGVQAILPRTGTGLPDSSPEPPEPDESEDDSAPREPDRPAPAPKTGRILDVTV